MAPKNSSREVLGLPLILKRCSSQVSVFPGSGQLPEDLLVDILCLLPIKYLMQCKCVSRAWCRLISHTCVQRISSTLPPVDGFLCRVIDYAYAEKVFMDYLSFDDPNNIEETSINPKQLAAGVPLRGFVGRYTALLPFNPSSDSLMDACHGLLLFDNWCSSSGSQYYMCNPTTKQYVRIPKADFDMEENCYAALAFDPSESPYYKVVRFPRTMGNSLPKHRILDIFTSDTGTWVKHKILYKPLDASDDDDERFMIRRSCYLDGVLYRICSSHHLVCFNLKRMTRQAVELPLKYQSAANRFIGVSERHLHYVNDDKARVLVWEFNASANACEKSEDTWILKHSIGFSSLIYHMPLKGSICQTYIQLDTCCKVFAIHPTTGIIYMGWPYTIFSHRLGSNELHEVCCISDQGKALVSSGTYFFVHSTCYVALNDFWKTSCY